ncbi:MAG: SLBB domain-containing protein, partial [Clostridium sp.]
MDINITKKQKVGIGVFLLLILVLTSFFYFKNKAQLPKDGIRKNRVLVEETSTKTNLIKADKGSSTDQSSYIKAYICGYVANPGVYTLNQGDRLDDLLRLAGGFTKEADPRGVNLAYLVKDQDYFRILSINETKDSIDNKPGDLSVNSMAGNKINTSSSE